MKTLLLSLAMAAPLAMSCSATENTTVDLGGGILQNAFLSGDLGSIEVDGRAQINLEDVPGEGIADLRVMREEDAGTGLIIIRTTGTTLEDFRPGMYVFNNADQVFEDNEVFVQLCSGPNRNTMSFETPGSVVALGVSAIAGGQHYEVVSTGVGEDGTTRASGNVTFDILASSPSPGN